MRALFYDKGYAVMIGYKGYGCTLTTKLACFLIGQGKLEVEALESGNQYIKFYNRLKEVIVQCGTNFDNGEFERKCMVLTDRNLSDERSADDLNYLFNHGDLPLY